MSCYRIMLIAFILLLPVFSSAQFTDDFSDGDFSNNPTWSGDTNVFDINTSQELWLNAPAVTSESYASLPSQAIENAQWDFYLHMDFNPSSSNNTRIYLVSDSPVLTGALNGYYIRVGGDNDEISLYRQTGTSTQVVVDGIDDRVNQNDVYVRIRVTRDIVGNWQVFSDTTGGTTYVSEGTGFDNTHLSTQHFGVLCDYTSTRSDKFFFDDFSVTGQPYTDTDPPVIDSVIVVSSTELDVYFNELLDPTSAQSASNYSVNNAVGTAATATLDVNDSSLVHLIFATNFPNALYSILTSSTVEDTAGNVMTTVNDTFFYFLPVAAQNGDVIFTEIYADYSPSNGLPASEYVEIYNASSSVFDLEDWVYTDASATTSDLDSYYLFPGEYLIICSLNDTNLFNAYPNVMGITPFPTLNNASDDLKLYDDNGTLIDQVAYTDSWYNDPSKANGGWSLELINPTSACTFGSANWTASNATIGGTPGTQNSVYSTIPDVTAPELLSATVTGASSILLTFNESMDSTSLMTATYSLSPALTVASINPIAPNFIEVELTFTTPIDSTVGYTITVTGATDCPGNVIGAVNDAFFAIGATPQANDVIITEIMADYSPAVALPNYEFIEIYNTSSSLFNLNNWEFGDLSSSGTFGNYLLYPGEYLIVCQEDDTTFFQPYGNVIGIAPFPTLNNDQDEIYLSAPSGAIVNQVAYTDEWYNDATKANGGWTLELINPTASCLGSSANWTASNDPSGGTPGTQNSVYNTAAETTAPELTDVDVISQTSILLTFSESMDSTSVVNATYNLNPTLTIAGIEVLAPFFNTAEITFNTPIDSAIGYTIEVIGAEDCSGNTIGTSNTSLFAIGATPLAGDVIFTEIFTDYSPQVGLPQTEYVEIYNNSNKLFNLNNWVYTDESTSEAEFDNYLLFPGEYIILCHRDDTILFTPYGNVIGLFPFPTLNNDYDDLQLYSSNGSLVDRVQYSEEWYNDATKEDGGWSFELINPQAICLNSPLNWTASNDPVGGTPGVQNSVYDLTPDTDAPELMDVSIESSTEIVLHFNESMDSASVVNATYLFTPTLTAATIEAFAPYYNEVAITFTAAIDSLTTYQVEVTNAEDCPGNTIGSLNQATFVIGKTPEIGDLILNELFPDPDTTVTILPNAEFVELFNNSNYPIRLTNCILSDETSNISLPESVLPSGGYIIICDEDYELDYSVFGNVLPLSTLPSLSNVGEYITLKDANGSLLDGIAYTKDTYQDDDKADGGWTLERINPDEPCGGTINWKASYNADGGTPGNQNSTYDPTFGTAQAELEGVVIDSIFQIEIFFTKTMDSASLANGTYTFSPSLQVLSIHPQAPQFSSVIVLFQEDLQTNTLYTVTVDSVYDCSGFPIGYNSGDFTLPNAGDLIINEVLFDPIGEGTDFVELYNNSGSAINLNGWALAYENSSGGTSYSTIINSTEIIYPGEFVLLNEDIDNLLYVYPETEEGTSIEMDLPSYSNTSGEVKLVSRIKNTIDEFHYAEDMHFALLKSTEGVSLERINYNRPTSDYTNWHSAAETAGFATPGYENSQYSTNTENTSEISIPDNTFSPDNDGFEDVLNIYYEFDEPGYVANVRIFDAEGREIRELVNNELLGTSGFFSWDGITDDYEKARVGIYAIFLEVFNTDGDKKVYKYTCVLATRF